MAATIGALALWWSLAFALLAALAAVVAATNARARWTAAARAAALGHAVLLTIAAAALETALLTSDFSIRYVAANSSRATPLIYKASALWGALEGSVLLWAWLLGLATAVVVVVHRRHEALLPVVIATLSLVSAFFVGVMCFISSPFERLVPVPLDGRGLNPLLENPGMAVHPPALYLGYVGFAVPFAFAIAALVTGRLGADWITATRRWTLSAWWALTIGILVGAWWAYRVLGWGGYWAWDPVENASLLPWLTGTAFLHSVMIQERRDMLKVWNLSLVILTFALTLFGTFLTRSGIISSVHAFASSPVLGVAFLGIVTVTLLGGFGLVAARGGQLGGRAQLESLASRESAFVLNNVVFLAAAFSVLFGTVYPLVSEALRGVKASVGAPYFNFVNFPVLLVVLFLMGVGPLIAWRRASLDHLRRNFLWPAAIALAAAALLAVLGVRHPPTVTIYALGVFVVVATVHDVWRSVRARAGGGGGRLAALVTVLGQNHRRHGGFVVHLGVVIVFVGVAGSSGYGTQVEQTVARGEAVTVGRYHLTFNGLRAADAGTHQAVVAAFDVTNSAAAVGRLEPAKLFYARQQEPLTRVAIRTTWREDLYVILTDFARDGSAATVKAVVSPLVVWLWVGGLVMTAGTAWALLPQRRRAR